MPRKPLRSGELARMIAQCGGQKLVKGAAHRQVLRYGVATPFSFVPRECEGRRETVTGSSANPAVRQMTTRRLSSRIPEDAHRYFSSGRGETAARKNPAPHPTASRNLFVMPGIRWRPGRAATISQSSAASSALVTTIAANSRMRRWHPADAALVTGPGTAPRGLPKVTA